MLELYSDKKRINIWRQYMCKVIAKYFLLFLSGVALFGFSRLSPSASPNTPPELFEPFRTLIFVCAIVVIATSVMISLYERVFLKKQKSETGREILMFICEVFFDLSKDIIPLLITAFGYYLISVHINCTLLDSTCLLFIALGIFTFISMLSNRQRHGN